MPSDSSLNNGVSMAAEEKVQLDFTVANYGTVWQFIPHTPEALGFAQQELDLQPWQWLGDTFSIEHRIAPAVLTAIVEEGWTVGPVEQTNVK